MILRLKCLFCCLSILLLSACSQWQSLVSYVPWLSTDQSLPLQVADQGVGAINATTVLERRQLLKALDGYQLPDQQSQWRYGMKMHAGQLQAFYQLVAKQQLVMTIYGQHELVNQVIVYDKAIKSQWGVQIGMSFTSLYHQAMGYCRWYDAANLEETTKQVAQQIICRAPQSHHVYYIFQGQWSGPTTLLPDNSALANWSIDKIVWRAVPLTFSNE